MEAPAIIRSAVPMEARSADALPEGEGWWFEPKWDGFRCLAFREDGVVRLQSKSGKSLSRFFPEVVAMLASLDARRFALDGELLIGAEGRFSFEALQARLHPAQSRIDRLAAETPAAFTVFDMLQAPSGEDLRSEFLAERRARLSAFIDANTRPSLTITPGTADRTLAQEWLDSGRLEGVIAKRLDGPYAEGDRAMIKVKRRRTADCVVGGFRYAAGKRVVGSLLLGLYNDQGLLDHVGFTSGLAGVDKAALTRELEALKAEPGFTGEAPGGPSRWATQRSGQWEPVKPVMVVEVSFDHVSGGRFRHGTRLIRRRPDKAPHQCRMEQIL